MLFRFFGEILSTTFLFLKNLKGGNGAAGTGFAVSVLAVPLRFSGAEHENEYFVRTFF